MLRRYLDMTMGPELAQGDLTPAQADSVRERAVSLRMDEPVFARTEAQCMAEVSRSEYDCAIEAPNANEWESCIE